MAKFYTPTRLSENIAETPEGYLFCLDVPIARTGWQDYAEGETPLKVGEEGVVKVYRSPEEVFRPQTIASFQGKSITIQHPADFVAPQNWKDLTKGTAQNVRKSEEKDENGEQCLLADLLITEAMAIQLVRNGLREVSCGYECEYEQTGEGKGKQFNIIGNHIALVEEGRAGSSYAINDHKGKVSMDPKKLIEKLKARFGAKVIDEAMAEEKKEEKAKDADEPPKEDKKEEKAKDDDGYDSMMKAVKDLSEKIDGMMKAGKDDKETHAEGGEPAEEKDAEAGMEERLKALETAVAKLLEKQTGDDKEDGDEESEDDMEEESPDMTGDTAARVEILSPGLKVTKGVDVKIKALENAYATKDGKTVIDTFTGGKKPVFDSKERVNTLFIAASECLKASRGTGLEKTKDGKKFLAEDGENANTPITAEKLNEIHAAHWARK